MINFQQILDTNGLTIAKVAEWLGKDRSTVSKIISGNYPNSEEWQSRILQTLQEKGFAVPEQEDEELFLDQDSFLSTMNVQREFAMMDGLLDPQSTLNSSIGCITGTAGRGKTYASKKYCQRTPQASYVLYVDGYSKVMLVKHICLALTGSMARSFDLCLQEIANACKVERRIVIIDEADKMHISYLEMLRAINEQCGLPIVLVGEEKLFSTVTRVPRLRSRIRNPHIQFEPITAPEVLIYYKEACRIDADAKAINYLLTKARGDFRTIVNDANAIVQAMNANGTRLLTEEIARSIYE